MRLPSDDGNGFLRLISIAPAAKKRRKKNGRSTTFQQLEAREVLTASIAVYDGDSDSKTFTITNPGSDTLHVNSLSLPGGFNTSTSFPLYVDPGQSATFDVEMDTSGVASLSGTMSLSSDDPQSPFHVSISG